MLRVPLRSYLVVRWFNLGSTPISCFSLLFVVFVCSSLSKVLHFLPFWSFFSFFSLMAHIFSHLSLCSQMPGFTVVPILPGNACSSSSSCSKGSSSSRSRSRCHRPLPHESHLKWRRTSRPWKWSVKCSPWLWWLWRFSLCPPPPRPYSPRSVTWSRPHCPPTGGCFLFSSHHTKRCCGLPRHATRKPSLDLTKIRSERAQLLLHPLFLSSHLGDWCVNCWCLLGVGHNLATMLLVSTFLVRYWS